ncbi:MULTISPECIES: hypothetical protein [Streptomyces]
MLDRAGWPANSAEASIGHQAHQRILDAVAARCGYRTIREVGNTAAVFLS